MLPSCLSQQMLPPSHPHSKDLGSSSNAATNCTWASGLTSLGFGFLICQKRSAYLTVLLSGTNEVRV